MVADNDSLINFLVSGVFSVPTMTSYLINLESFFVVCVEDVHD